MQELSSESTDDKSDTFTWKRFFEFDDESNEKGDQYSSWTDYIGFNYFQTNDYKPQSWWKSYFGFGDSRAESQKLVGYLGFGVESSWIDIFSLGHFSEAKSSWSWSSYLGLDASNWMNSLRRYFGYDGNEEWSFWSTWLPRWFRKDSSDQKQWGISRVVSKVMATWKTSSGLVKVLLLCLILIIAGGVYWLMLLKPSVS